jgi:2-alkenal reductase
MDRERASRLRKAAVTRALAPGLTLGLVGALGLGILSHDISPTSVAAKAVVDGGACTAFGAPAAPTSDLSVADVAEEANPAVVTVENYQSISDANMTGFTGIDGLPQIPGLPNIGLEPGSGLTPGTEPSIGNEPSANDSGDDQQIQGDQSDLVPVGAGSGFIVDQDGHVVTNAHVVDGARELHVTFFDGTDVPAELVGHDDLIDVAVLKLDLTIGTTIPGVVSFGDSSTLRPGDQVVAIGTALGEFPNSVSEGTVNALHRSFGGAYGLSAMIQHDAEIWHGNSGGPLLNLRGQVIGVNTAGIGGSELGTDTGSADMAFAVEGNTICNAAAELIANGSIAWPYLGIQGEATRAGQNVVDVSADGPSDAAGLEAGDVITEFDGQKVDRQHTLLDLLFAHQPGDVVDVTVDRNGAVHTFQVTLGERPNITE